MALAQTWTELEIQIEGKGFTRLNERVDTWLRSTEIDQGVCASPACTRAEGPDELLSTNLVATKGLNADHAKAASGTELPMPVHKTHPWAF